MASESSLAIYNYIINYNIINFILHIINIINNKYKILRLKTVKKSNLKAW